MGLCGSNPAARIRRKTEDNGRVRLLAKQEEAAVRKVLARDYSHYLPAFTISINTGVRASEQWRARWPDIDFTRRLFTVRNTKNGDPERHVPLNALALAAFQQLRQRNPKGTGAVFRDERGGALRGHRQWV